MKFLCPTCRTPLPGAPAAVVACTACGVAVDLTRVETAPGTATLPPEVDLSGEALGEWVLGQRLGAGGMGAVYEASGPSGPCAVKVLSSLVAAEPAVRERFRREAGALRAITHPRVVRILAEGEERGFCWYAMERVDGSDLRARITQGPLPASEVVALARALLEALAAVHATGVVHRDVKPANILLSSSGPKLCDFGIARFDGASTLTESAALMGSLRYMAPEQRRGLADAKSDLYALGLSLHEAWTGGLPPETPLPSSPAALRRLVTQLTQERPHDRPDSAADALGLLKHRSRAWAAGVGAATAAVAATVFAWTTPTTTTSVSVPVPTPVRAMTAPPQAAQTQQALPPEPESRPVLPPNAQANTAGLAPAKSKAMTARKPTAPLTKIAPKSTEPSFAFDTDPPSSAQSPKPRGEKVWTGKKKGRVPQEQSGDLSAIKSAQ